MISPPQMETWRTACPLLHRNSQLSIVPFPEELRLTPAPHTLRGESMQRCCAPSYMVPPFRYLAWTVLNILLSEDGQASSHALFYLVLQACHDVVEREPYFRLCLSDVCGCAPPRACHCTILTAYARQCAQEGTAVNWRNQTFCRKSTGAQCDSSLLIKWTQICSLASLSIWYYWWSFGWRILSTRV